MLECLRAFELVVFLRSVSSYKPLATGVLIGLILVVLGIAALAVPSFTFFNTERVALLPSGFSCV